MGSVAACVLTPALASAVTVPPDFVVENAVPGATFDTPTGIAFLPGGRMLVAEKRGRVYSVSKGVKYPTPMWARESEVLNESDRGLLGIAVDPGYVSNRFIYLLYIVDPDSDGVDNNGNGFGRLVRYRVSATDSNVVDTSSRTTLMGASWTAGSLSDFPSHSAGSLRWGTDGSLLVSIGEGASYTGVDPGGLDPTAFGAGKTDPYEDIGAFRAQYVGSLCGKILRLNPATGRGYASNPYFDGNLSSVRSRVWAYGLRNPFRFCVRPGSGSADTAAANPGALYIGDVGWETWEELDVARSPGLNFGWPCYEGLSQPSGYQTASPSHNGCGTMGTPQNPGTYAPPVATWNHWTASLSTPPGFIGNCSVGGTFYSGTRYPAPYRGAYFFADYGQNWIKVATMSAGDQLVSIQNFAGDLEGPVDLAPEPSTGDLYYVSIASNQVRRIRYTGAGSAGPLALADASPTVGAVPLAVVFSSAGSADPGGGPITYAWNFGDQSGSTSANPTHTYTAPGTYTVILTVSDGHGGQASDSVIVQVTATSAFPTTPVLDTFNRANGPIGGAWADQTAGLVIDSNALAQTGGSATTVWSGGAFGPDQEAFVTLSALTAGASEHDLMLKVQGTTWSSGHIEVRYDGTYPRVVVSTYSSQQGWQARGILGGLSFQPGDQLGARAYANGTVQVYKNGAAVGTASVAGWPYAALGGRLGLTIAGATSSRLDNFGGGTASLLSNTPPIATILKPLDRSFYAEGVVVQLAGSGSDTQDPPGNLRYHWQVDLHHNNHIHPSSFVSDSATASFLGQNHDDGTGVYLAIQLTVTDAGGMSDTAKVSIFPEIDLWPSPVVTAPSQPSTTAPSLYRFTLHNGGRMPAPWSHWMLVADSQVLAQGDTLVPKLDSVAVSLVLPPSLAAGSHAVRVAVDTLGQVVETSETNNGATRTITVVSNPLDAPADPPRAIALSSALPNPTRGMVSMALDLPRSAKVSFGVVDLMGRSVWNTPARAYGPGRWKLSWEGRSRGGRPVRPGVYLARVAVDGAALVRRVTVLE